DAAEAKPKPIDADLAELRAEVQRAAQAMNAPPADGLPRTKLEEPKNHGGYFGFAVSPDGKKAAGGTGVGKFSAFGQSKTVGGEARVWATESGRLEKTLGSHGETVRWLAFAGAGRTLVSISNENAMAKAWNVESGEEAASLELGGEFDINGPKPVLAPTGDW